MGKVFLVKMLNKTTEEFRYKLGNFKGTTYLINTPVSPMPIPEEDSSENVLIKIEGNSSQLELGWTIKDVAANLESVVPVATKTVSQQLKFFRNDFRPQSIEDSYRLVLQFGDTPNNDVDIVFLGTFSQFKFTMSDPNLLTFNATCKFMEGDVVLLFEVDVASEPLNLSLTTSSKTINADWDAPEDSGDSNISDYNVYFRKFNSGNAFDVSNVGSASSVLSDISGATVLDNAVYEVYVRGITDIGEGRASQTKNIVVLP